jgi:hypothetical protein
MCQKYRCPSLKQFAIFKNIDKMNATAFNQNIVAMKGLV